MTESKKKRKARQSLDDLAENNRPAYDFLIRLSREIELYTNQLNSIEDQTKRMEVLAILAGLVAVVLVFISSEVFFPVSLTLGIGALVTILTTLTKLQEYTETAKLEHQAIQEFADAAIDQEPTRHYLEGQHRNGMLRTVMAAFFARRSQPEQRLRYLILMAQMLDDSVLQDEAAEPSYARLMVDEGEKPKRGHVFEQPDGQRQSWR